MSYVYQPFPKMLYQPGDATKIVRTQVELDAALAAGWSLRPVVDAPVPAVQDPSGWPIDGLSVPFVQDPNVVDPDVTITVTPDPAEPVKRGPGRPRKVR